jgi:uncharacterized repeat protein (TIGR03843 family)
VVRADWSKNPKATFALGTTVISTDPRDGRIEGDVSEVLGLLPDASNTTLLAKDANGLRVVYKPDEGARPLHDFDARTLSAREVLASKIDQALGFDAIPETVFIDGPYGRGSAQRLISEAFETDPRPMLQGPNSDLWPLAVIDIIANNADRKLGHLLIEEGTGDVWGIDNGLMFHPEPKLRTVLWGFAGIAIPEPVHDGLQRLSEALGEGLGREVADMLSPEEASALENRTNSLIADGVHPQPPTDRHAVPWPWW